MIHCRAIFILLYILVVPCASFASTPVSASNGADLSCVPTDAEPVKVCFATPALTVDHCSKKVVPHFVVARKRKSSDDDAYYYFLYELRRNGVTKPFNDPFGGKYVLRSDDASADAGPKLHIPYEGEGEYEIRVEVHVDGREQAAFATSGPRQLADPAVVKAVVVGISNYDDESADNLLHADSDAETFAQFIEDLFPSSPQPVILTSRKTDASLVPTKENIISQLQTAADNDGDLCTDDDWFIFYFSGHGIVAVNRNEVGHFLSTKTFNPKELRRTAIRIPELLDAITNIRAKNKLIILDSCFSGTSAPPNKPKQGTASTFATSPTISPPSQRPHRSTKVEYVVDNQVRPAFQISTPDFSNLGGDTLALQQTAEREDRDQRRVLYLSAANAVHEAEEGYVYYENQLNFTPSDVETDEQRVFGHGLYTYSWLWNALKRVPLSVTLPNFPTPPNPAQRGPCQIDFMSVATAVGGQIDDLRESEKQKEKPRDFQTPDTPVHSAHVPGPAGCESSKKEN